MHKEPFHPVLREPFAPEMIANQTTLSSAPSLSAGMAAWSVAYRLTGSLVQGPVKTKPRYVMWQ
jgi:hypothetical protein